MVDGTDYNSCSHCEQELNQQLRSNVVGAIRGVQGCAFEPHDFHVEIIWTGTRVHIFSQFNGPIWAILIQACD